jgi:hypothetical protein
MQNIIGGMQNDYRRLARAFDKSSIANFPSHEVELGGNTRNTSVVGCHDQPLYGMTMDTYPEQPQIGSKSADLHMSGPSARDRGPSRPATVGPISTTLYVIIVGVHTLLCSASAVRTRDTAAVIRVTPTPAILARPRAWKSSCAPPAQPARNSAPSPSNPTPSPPSAPPSRGSPYNNGHHQRTRISAPPSSPRRRWKGTRVRRGLGLRAGPRVHLRHPLALLPAVRSLEPDGSGAPAPARKPPLHASGGGGGWDDWDDDFWPDMRRNQSVGSFAATGAQSGRQPPRSKSTQDIYTRQQLEASVANKDDFFARRMAENESKPEGIPPSQGGKYVGFGSSPAPSANRNGGAAQGDVLQVVSQVKKDHLCAIAACNEQIHFTRYSSQI